MNIHTVCCCVVAYGRARDYSHSSRRRPFILWQSKAWNISGEKENAYKSLAERNVIEKRPPPPRRFSDRMKGKRETERRRKRKMLSTKLKSRFDLLQWGDAEEIKAGPRNESKQIVINQTRSTSNVWRTTFRRMHTYIHTHMYVCVRYVRVRRESHTLVFWPSSHLILDFPQKSFFCLSRVFCRERERESKSGPA